MIDWMNRAQRKFAEPGATPAAKTDEAPVLSVSSVGMPALIKNEQGFPSVFAVHPALTRDPTTLEADLLDVAMRVCHLLGDGDEARVEMRVDCLATPDHLRAELVDHFRQAARDAANPWRVL